MARIIRVTRTIVIEGPEHWVDMTIQKSYVNPEHPVRFIPTMTDTNRIEETAHVREVFETGPS